MGMEEMCKVPETGKGKKGQYVYSHWGGGE